jgi:hypothetical protein
VEWDLKKQIKSYSNNYWLWCWEQTWFDIVDTFHVITFKSEYYWWRDNNYTKKLNTESSSQTTYDFFNTRENMTGC